MIEQLEPLVKRGKYGLVRRIVEDCIEAAVEEELSILVKRLQELESELDELKEILKILGLYPITVSDEVAIRAGQYKIG